MKIVVLVKIIDGEVNIFDQSALESALCVDGAEVTIVSMCPPSAADKLRSLTRLGVKRVILVSDSGYAGSDTLATSYILSKVLEKLEYDYVFCGRQTTDGDTAQVGPCLATMLGTGLITNVLKINNVENEIDCDTRVGNEKSKLPALITVERINTLRFPSIRSKVGEIEVWDNSKIGADLSRCGLNGSPTRVMKVFEKKNDGRRCKYITVDELKPLIDKVMAEQRAELKPETDGIKLKSVWAIGHKVEEKSLEIAEEVVVIEETDPYKIAEMAKIEKPEVILWNADLWGRKNAPIVSALLQTGLCADCTQLETDGTRLYMYRPARSGNVTAKIECRTNPQMATVRTVQDSNDIIVSAGRGVVDEFEDIKNFAKSINAEVCASRGLVDTGAAPYEMQVGLTGKNVSPKVYIAVGISGAVHHTVAIENADVVIAVNPDKNARIFEYSDYGIVAKAEVLKNI